MSFLEAVDPLLLVLAGLIMLFAGLVHGTLGLGFPVVSTPLLAALFDVHTAILMTLLPTLAVNVASIRSGEDWTGSLARYWPLLLSGLAGGIFGTWVLTISPPGPFKLLLALLVLLFLWSSRSERSSLAWVATHPLGAMLFFGLGAGFSGGTTNVTVAVLIIYFLSTGLARSVMVPILNTFFMIGKLAQIAVLAVAGFVTASLLLATTPFALLALGGLMGGQRLRDRVPVETYRRILQGLLLVIAVVLMVQFALDPIGERRW